MEQIRNPNEIELSAASTDVHAIDSIQGIAKLYQPALVEKKPATQLELAKNAGASAFCLSYGLTLGFISNCSSSVESMWRCASSPIDNIPLYGAGLLMAMGISSARQTVNSFQSLRKHGS